MKNNFKKIFITGGAGFIGSHVSEAFFENFKKSKIIILDKLTYAGNKAFLSSIINSKRVKFIKGEMAEWFKAHAWKVCVLLKVPRVRIPVSPPFIIFKF
jgi:dTDP-D-glucose 4,6-dehydratase